VYACSCARNDGFRRTRTIAAVLSVGACVSSSTPASFAAPFNLAATDAAISFGNAASSSKPARMGG